MQPKATLAVITAAVENPSSGMEDFDTVVRLYWPRIFRFALASLRDPDAAGSVAQDCFLKARKAGQRFRGDCSLHTWLMHIAVNLVRDYARNRRLQFWKRAQASALDVEAFGTRVADPSASPEARALAKEQVQAVWSAVRNLPGRQRTVFLLRFVEEMDAAEIAAATGMKEGTVKVHLFRALQSIRERLKGTK